VGALGSWASNTSHQDLTEQTEKNKIRNWQRDEFDVLLRFTSQLFSVRWLEATKPHFQIPHTLASRGGVVRLRAENESLAG
jgi:hypothetical protein